MAAITDSPTNGCTFLWKIENISQCWLKKGQRISSPCFIADALEGSKWHLNLYPMGNTDKIFSLYIYREKDCLETDIDVNCQLAILAKDDSFLIEQTMAKCFSKEKQWGFKVFDLRDKIFISEREAYLPEDTLTVQCTIWKKEETLCNPKYLHARTAFKVNRRSFVWEIEEFSTLKNDTRYKFKDDLIEFYLNFNKILDFTRKLDIHIISFDENIKYFSFKTNIINTHGEKEDFGKHQYFGGELKNRVLSTLISSKMLIENKVRYLPNDVLSLDCEYIYSNGAVSHEFCSYGTISSNVTKAVIVKNREYPIEKEKPQIFPVLVNDLKSVYDDRILCDIELRTATETFPAHKIILSARSPVFKRMLNNDRKENNIGHIDITDLENDSIHRMLQYMYTDTVEDMPFENGCKLYSAADKYDILSLKSRCSSFLKENLCPTTACELLVLADLHQDDDLKSTVQDYILNHDKEVFGSQEWKNFMCRNIQLAADIMYLKVFPG